MQNRFTHHRPPPTRRAEAAPAIPGPPHQRRLLRICGLAAVRALFARAPERVERLFFVPHLAPELGAFCAVLAAARRPYREIDAAALARIGGTVLHGGIVAVARPQPLGILNPEAPLRWARDGRPILVLDGVGNPHNLGAIARSAAFFGLERVVLIDRPEQALPSDASYRIAEGGFEHLCLYQAPLLAAFAALRRAYRIVGTAAGGREPVLEWRGERPPALVLGNEETGLDRATLAACDTVATIPGCGRVQSLNVAAAAAILLHLATTERAAG
jgi:RNA methyltransferase, TrmH family